jgi:transposase
MNNSTLFVGVDISKTKHDIAIMNHHKKLVHKPFVIKENYNGYQYLINKLEGLKQTYSIQRFCIGMEATGDYWKNLFHFLTNKSHQFKVTVINPIQTRAFANTELRRAKTDPINAKDIALFMIEKQPQPYRNLPIIFECIKDIDQQIHLINKQKTMKINKLRIELAKTAPEIESGFKNFNAKQILAILAQFSTAEEINKASVDDLRTIRYGAMQWRVDARIIDKIKMAIEHSIAYKKGKGADIVVKSLIRQIQNDHLEIEQLRSEMNQLYAFVKEQKSLLTTIPGIGLDTAIVLEAYIGDVNRFDNAKKIVAYFGLNPVVCRSGKDKNRTSRLQKKGSGVVRRKLFMAVITIISKKQGPIYKYYRRLVDSGKPKLVAVGAAMRKLLEVIYAMLKNNESFDPDKIG